MDLEKISIQPYNQMIDLEDIQIDTSEFYKIIEITKLALSKIGIEPDGLKIYYQRNSDASSMLAIQVTRGVDNDIENYMFNCCKAWKHDLNVTCDVYLHAEAKSA